MFVFCVHVITAILFTFLNVNFLHQIVPELPQNANEIVWFLKKFKSWVFMKSRLFFFSNKNLSLFSFVKGGKTAVACVSNGKISSKCLIHPGYEVFSAKYRKFLNDGKLWRKFDYVQQFSREKKTFSSSQNPSLWKWEGAKYAGGSRLSSFSFSALVRQQRGWRSLFCFVGLPFLENSGSISLFFSFNL